MDCFGAFRPSITAGSVSQRAMVGVTASGLSVRTRQLALARSTVTGCCVLLMRAGLDGALTGIFGIGRT
jgi:hypothetical protein